MATSTRFYAVALWWIEPWHMRCEVRTLIGETQGMTKGNKCALFRRGLRNLTVHADPNPDCTRNPSPNRPDRGDKACMP